MSVCDSIYFLYAVPRASVLALEGMKVGDYLTGETPLVSIPLTALVGWQVKDHLSSSCLNPCFCQTLSFSLAMHCEMARRSGDRKEEGTCICRKSTKRQKEGRVVSVERNGETKSKVVLLCTGLWKESMLHELGERGGATALLGCHSSCLPSPGTVCVMRESERSHISLATETASWLAGSRVTPAGDGEDPPQAGHTELCRSRHSGCKAALTPTSPRTPRESYPRVRVHCARCLEQLDQRLREASRMDGGGHGICIPNASH